MAITAEKCEHTPQAIVLPEGADLAAFITAGPEIVGACSWCWAPAEIAGIPAPIVGQMAYRRDPKHPTGKYVEQRYWSFWPEGAQWAYTLDGITVLDGSRSRPTKGRMAGVGPFMCRDCHEASR